MDLSNRVDLQNKSKKAETWRLIISLTLSLGAHAVLICIPIALAPRALETREASRTPIEIILIRRDIKKVPPVANSKIDYLTVEPNSTHSISPQKPENNTKERSSEVEPRRKSTIRENYKVQVKTKLRPEKHPVPTVINPQLSVPTDPRAGSQSTVFDPKLEEKLIRDRNKVRKFLPKDARYKTSTGRFVQIGDRCWDVKDVPVSNKNSDLNPWFRAKCPNNSRAQSDIDRLAEKYGIP